MKQSTSPVVDRLIDKEISNCFRLKLSSLLNSSDTTLRNVLLDDVFITVADIDDVDIYFCGVCGTLLG